MQSRCLPRYFFAHARLSLPLERVLFHALAGIERSNVTAWPANGRHSRPLWPRQTSTTFLENPSATLASSCLLYQLLLASCTENASLAASIHRKSSILRMATTASRVIPHGQRERSRYYSSMKVPRWRCSWKSLRIAGFPMEFRCNVYGLFIGLSDSVRACLG